MISPVKKIKLSLLIFLVIFVTFLIFAVIPFLKDVQETSQNLAFQEGVLNLFGRQIVNLNNFQSNYEFQRLILEKVEKSFVDFEAPIDFIEFLEETAKKENIIMRIRPLPALTNKGDLWSTVGFQIMVGGSFSNCLRFLEKLEYGPWLVDINQLYIERIQENTQRSEEFSQLKIGDVTISFSSRVFAEITSNPLSSDIKPID